MNRKLPKIISNLQQGLCSKFSFIEIIQNKHHMQTTCSLSSFPFRPKKRGRVSKITEKRSLKTKKTQSLTTQRKKGNCQIILSIIQNFDLKVWRRETRNGAQWEKENPWFVSFSFRHYSLKTEKISLNQTKGPFMHDPIPKKKTYICHGSGYRFETLETALFKNEVSFTWTLKTKPIETNEVKPPLHFAFTFRVFHCGKKDPTFLDFSKKEKKSSLKSLGNSDETQSRKFIFFHKILEFFFKKTVQYFYMHMHMHI